MSRAAFNQIAEGLQEAIQFARASVPPLYYFKRGNLYLHWSGLCFTDHEERAWLGTADHVDAFRRHHWLARSPGVSIITAEAHVPEVAA